MTKRKLRDIQERAGNGIKYTFIDLLPAFFAGVFITGIIALLIFGVLSGL